jgi:hypothetical protein
MQLCDYATVRICSRQGALVDRQQTIATTHTLRDYATMRLRSQGWNSCGFFCYSTVKPLLQL